MTRLFRGLVALLVFSVFSAACTSLPAHPTTTASVVPEPPKGLVLTGWEEWKSESYGRYSYALSLPSGMSLRKVVSEERFVGELVSTEGLLLLDFAFELIETSAQELAVKYFERERYTARTLMVAGRRSSEFIYVNELTGQEDHNIFTPCGDFTCMFEFTFFHDAASEKMLPVARRVVESLQIKEAPKLKGLVLASWSCRVSSEGKVVVKGDLENYGPSLTDLVILVEWLASDGVSLGEDDLLGPRNPVGLLIPETINLVVGYSQSFRQDFPRYSGVSLCRPKVAVRRMPTKDEFQKGLLWGSEKVKFSVAEGVVVPAEIR